MRGLRIEFGTVRSLQAQHRAGEPDRRQLEAEAHALEGNLVLRGESGRGDLSLDPAVSEAAGHKDAIRVFEQLGTLLLQVDGFDPVQFHVHPGGRTRVVERLDVADVGIFQVGVLAHQGDRDLFLRVSQVLEERPPLPQVFSLRTQAEGLHRILRETLAVEEEGDVVDRRRVGRADHAFHGDVGEERDLLFDVRLQRVFAPGDDHVGLDPRRSEFSNALLRRLRLLLADGPHDGHEGRVHEQDILLSDLLTELADGFEEGHALDVSDRPTDLDEDDVGMFLLPDLAEQGLDLVRDVRDDLHGLSEVVAATLFLNDRPVDLPRRDVVVPGQIHIEDPLVTPQIQVDLRPVIEDEHLPVLVRVHRPRVHVQVGIDLDLTDLQSLRLQEDADGRGADALPEARQNATRDDDIFHVKSRDWTIQRVRDKLCVKNFRRAPEGSEGPVNPLTDCRLVGLVTPWN